MTEILLEGKCSLVKLCLELRRLWIMLQTPKTSSWLWDRSPINLHVWKLVSFNKMQSFIFVSLLQLLYLL